ncbi:unnamed protein product [Colias eurytheme]|nr:unnamed protein product [Colias eurytheme]
MRVTIITLFLILHHCIPEKISVLILARGGSKGIRLKNLRELGGITLLSRAIFAAQNAGLEDITVSTDHPLIALEGVKRRVQIFKRSYVTATDWAPSIWGVQEFLEYRPEVDILVLLQVTSPFTNSKHIKRSLEKLDSPKPYDCIFSVTRSYKLRWNLCDQKVYPVNFHPTRRPRRQDWNGEYIETGAFYISRKSIVLQGFLQNNNCTICEVTQYESLEIDTEYDIHMANAYLSHKHH